MSAIDVNLSDLISVLETELPVLQKFEKMAEEDDPTLDGSVVFEHTAALEAAVLIFNNWYIDGK